MRYSIPRLLPIFVMAALSLSVQAFAQFALPIQVLGNGASDMSDGTTHLRGTLGEPIIGTASVSGQETWQGFWYSIGHTSPSAVNSLPPAVPGEFALRANYPNPFNPTTQIVFDVPRAAKVTIRVFNIAGELVTTLADRPYEAGRHEIQWNAERLASGTYMISMAAPEFHSVRTMTLLK